MRSRDRIEHLTPEQEARFGEFVERWTAVGLCTDPADREKAEVSIRDAYRIAGRKPPERIVWCGSPLGQALTRAIVLRLAEDDHLGASVGDSVGGSVGASVRASVRASVWASVRDSVRASVWASVGDSVRDSVGASVWDSVWASVWDSVRDSVGASVRDSVGASVWDSVWASVWDSVGDSVRDSVGASVRDSIGASVRARVWASVGASVGDSVRDSVGASVRDSVWDSVGASVRDSVWDSVRASVWDSVRDSVLDSGYGQHEASWIAFYAFFAEVCGLTAQTKNLVGIHGITESAGWWLPHENICWVSERHNVCKLDPEQRLHCEDGPAVAYPDGWKIWAWHGVRVPQDVIEQPETITAERIVGERNVEVRRAMLEKVGYEPLLSVAKRLGRDEYGELLRIDQADDEAIVLVKVVNSTPEPDGSFKDYVLRVDPGCRTAREAVAWTFDVPAGEYAPVVET